MDNTINLNYESILVIFIVFVVPAIITYLLYKLNYILSRYLDKIGGVKFDRNFKKSLTFIYLFIYLREKREKHHDDDDDDDLILFLFIVLPIFNQVFSFILLFNIMVLSYFIGYFGFRKFKNG